MPLGSKRWLYTKSIVELEREEYGIYELLDSSYSVHWSWKNIENLSCSTLEMGHAQSLMRVYLVLNTLGLGKDQARDARRRLHIIPYITSIQNLTHDYHLISVNEMLKTSLSI